MIDAKMAKENQKPNSLIFLVKYGPVIFPVTCILFLLASGVGKAIVTGEGRYEAVVFMCAIIMIPCMLLLFVAFIFAVLCYNCNLSRGVQYIGAFFLFMLSIFFGNPVFYQAHLIF